MEHTFKAVDAELQSLGAVLADMGDLAVAQLRAALDAFARQDAAAGAAIAAGDARLDALEADVERRAVRFIALRQPMADDLRRPITAMKLASQLERCGDLAKNLAKRISKLGAAPTAAQLDGVGGLGALVADRLARVVDAYRRGDAAAAVAIWSSDTEVDDLHERVFQDVAGAMARDPSTIDVCTHLLFITKNLERIGDHATNIAELANYEITGQRLGERPKG